MNNLIEYLKYILFNLNEQDLNTFLSEYGTYNGLNYNLFAYYYPLDNKIYSNLLNDKTNGKYYSYEQFNNILSEYIDNISYYDLFTVCDILINSIDIIKDYKLLFAFYTVLNLSNISYDLSKDLFTLFYLFNNINKPFKTIIKEYYLIKLSDKAYNNILTTVNLKIGGIL